MKELHTIENQKGFYELNKVKVMYEVKEFSTFCTFKSLENNKIEIKFLNESRGN